MATTQAPHLSTGFQGEDQAAAYLQGQGFSVLHRNYRTGKAEVDIIAQKEGVLVFVEVKTRANNAYGFPEESVSERKQQLLLNAADAYIAETGWQHDIRFDIISITLGSRPELFHVVDAFH